MRHAAALVLLLTAGPAFAQSATEIDRLVAAIEAHGCIVNEANNHAILAATGMTEAEGSQIVMALMSTGRAVPHGDDLKLTTGKCK